MSGGKETPRQKMIGMMYLVLTALLALNVSKEILNAFVIVENGLNTTNKNFDGKNGVLYAKFEKALAENKTKTKPWYDKAIAVRKKSQDLCKIVDDIRSELYLKVQKLPSKEVADTFSLKQLDSKDNFDIPTHYLLGETPEEPKEDAKAIELKNAIIKYKKELIDIVPKEERSGLKIGLNTEDVYSFSDEKTVHWEFNNFDHTTMAADMCIFAALKNDIKNAESDVVGILLRAIDAGDFKFDAIEAKVVAESNYVIAGEPYKADIFVSAHSSTQNPEVLIGKLDTTDTKHPKVVGEGQKVEVVAGVGKLVVPTGAEGSQEYSGVINVKGPTGEISAYKFHNSYMVAKPSFSVAPTKMNVFYIGVANPVDISAAGAAPTQVNATISGCGGTIVNKGQGHYEVMVTTPGECTINVAIKDAKTGQSKSMGAGSKFRVKKVPSPNAKFAGVLGDGPASLNEIQNAPGVSADMGDFLFDLKMPVVSWNMSVVINGLFADSPAQGPGTTAAQKANLMKVKKGGRVMIEDVYVMAPEGKRKIPGCSIRAK